MTNWHSYLHPHELTRLGCIDTEIAERQQERRAMHNRAKQRKHRAALQRSE